MSLATCDYCKKENSSELFSSFWEDFLYNEEHPHFCCYECGRLIDFYIQQIDAFKQNKWQQFMKEIKRDN